MPTKKSKPIKDLSAKQWDRVERAVGGALMYPADLGLIGVAMQTVDIDRTIALHALDQAVGRDGHDADGNHVRIAPTGGYTDELVDGVVSTVKVRRKQLAKIR